MNLKNLLSLTLLFAFDLLTAQQWNWLSRISVDSYYNHSALSPNGKLHIAIGPYMHEVSASGATLAAGNYSGTGLQLQALSINSKGNLVLGGWVSGSFTLAGQPWANSTAANAIFIAELTPQYAQVWSHVIGGQFQSELHDLGVDKNDSVYFTGKCVGTFNFLGKQLTGRSGSSFVAKLSPAGNLDWVYADSSNNSSSDGRRISVNLDGESVVSIQSNSGNYFYFNGTPFNFGNPQYYYGDVFGLLLKPDGSVIYARSDRKPKWADYTYIGLTSGYWHRMEEGVFGGDYFSSSQEYDFTGDTTGSCAGYTLDPDDNYIKFLGIVDDKPYFLCSSSFYTNQGKQFENNISVFEQHQMKHLIKFSGAVSSCHLQKRSDNVYVLDGIFNRYLSLGQLSMTTPSIGVSGSGDTTYSSHTFITAFTLGGGTDIKEHSKTKIRAYPNPSQDKLFVSGCALGMSVFAFNAIGQKTKCAVNENEIDVSELSAGVYFIELKSGDRRSAIKFIKE